MVEIVHFRVKESGLKILDRVLLDVQPSGFVNRHVLLLLEAIEQMGRQSAICVSIYPASSYSVKR